MLEMIGESLSKVAEVAGKTVEKAGEVSASAIEQPPKTVEFSDAEIHAKRSTIMKPDMGIIKETSLKSIMATNMDGISQTISEWKADALSEVSAYGVAKEAETAVQAEAETPSLEDLELTEEEKALIIKETGWSDEIVNSIKSMEQYEVYKNAGLHEAEIDGRKCLVKDIDMDYKDPKTGLTNRELMEKGRAPIDAKTGEKIELHHMGQDFNSPLAELCENSEHGDGKDGILHDKKVESWRQDPEKSKEYNNVQRPNHWKARSKEV